MDTKGKVVRIIRGTVIDVYRTFDNCIVAVYDGKFYETKDAVVDRIRPEESPKPEKPHWKPDSNHPWRRAVVSRKRKTGGN